MIHLFICVISHGCTFINGFDNEFVFDITGSILEHNQSRRILKNTDTCPCISYDCSGLDNVGVNLYTAVARMGRKAFGTITAPVWGKLIKSFLFRNLLWNWTFNKKKHKISFLLQWWPFYIFNLWKSRLQRVSFDQNEFSMNYKPGTKTFINLSK